MTTAAGPSQSTQAAARAPAVPIWHAPINLVPLRRLEAAQRRGWKAKCVAACSAFGLLVAGVSASARLLADRGLAGDHEADAATRLTEANDQLGRSTEAVAREQASLNEAESLLTASRAMVEQPDWSRLMGLVAAKAQGEVMLKGCGIRPREDPSTRPPPPPPPQPGKRAAPPPPPDPTILVSLTGMAASQSAASQYALRLEGTGLFGRVTLNDTNREQFGGVQVVTFRIECTLADPTAVKAAKPPAATAMGGTKAKRSVAGGGEP